MKNWFLILGCWLTGYNWNILGLCSETSKMKIKKYTSALLIITILWFGVGFTFSSRYLQLGTEGAVLGGVVFAFIIVMVERQIILSSHNKAIYVFRMLLGLVMAIIGSIVIDQMILQEDINLEKKFVTDEKVSKIYPVRSAELRKQIDELSQDIEATGAEAAGLSDYLARHATIYYDNTRKEILPDYNGVQQVRTISERTEKENPRFAELARMEERLETMRDLSEEKKNDLLALHATIVEEVQENNGFLDELSIMMRILKASPVALAVWLLWFGFLLSLEVLILITKISERYDEEDDYSLRLKAQIHINKVKMGTLITDATNPRIYN